MRREEEGIPGVNKIYRRPSHRNERRRGRREKQSREIGGTADSGK
jgi:hypothetical protein